LEISKLVYSLFGNNDDYEIIFTRNKDEFIELSERAFIAAEKKADIFILLECYEAEKDKKGTEIWLLNNIQGENNIEFSKYANQSVLLENNYDSIYDYNKDDQLRILKNKYLLEKNILLDTNYIKKSKFLANNYIENMLKNKFVINKEINYGYLLLLHYINVPSFVVFLGNLNNEDDVKTLTNDESKRKISESFVKTIVDYNEIYIKNVNKSETKNKFHENLILENLKKEMKDKEDLQTSIFFDFAKHTLVSNSILELDKKIIILKRYENLKLEIKCHSDSRGKSDYNLNLSILRSNSIKNYLIKNGISENRIIYIGVGEQEILNKCEDGIECTEEEHSKNRRVEFTIK
jgi:outer membrane protein OmpA-like peptidoglycan-associated protein